MIFFFQEDILCKIKELPKLLRLHATLTRHFCFRIDKMEAQEMTIEEAIKGIPEGFFLLTVL